jgi:peroxiredoxin
MLIRPRQSISWLRASAVFLIGCSLYLNAVLVVQVSRLKSTLRAKTEIELGATAPPITVKAISGEKVTITLNARTRPTVLYIFSPSCGWCDENLDNIRYLAKRKSAQYDFVGLSVANDGLADYASRHDLNFPVFDGLTIEAFKAYRLGRTPQTLVVSPQGRVLANWVGTYEGSLRPRIEEFFSVSLASHTEAGLKTVTDQGGSDANGT